MYENPYQHIYRVQADFGDFTKEYFVTDSGHRAGIVAIRNGSVLLVRQYRFLINDLSWEVPGGRVDEGESPQCAAVRECLEETGVKCLNPRPLVFYHKGLDTSYNPTHIFFADKISEITEDEKIHSREVSGSEWVPLNRCIDMIFEGQIADCFSIAAILAYHARPNRVQLESK